MSCPNGAARCSQPSSAAASAASFRTDADLGVAVDALHGAVFYRVLLSGEPVDDEFAERVADQVLEGLAAR